MCGYYRFWSFVNGILVDIRFYSRCVYGYYGYVYFGSELIVIVIFRGVVILIIDVVE